MKITTLNIGSLPASYGIVLGRRGETEAAQIIFDVSSLVSTYGDGSAVLMVKRPGDTDAYPAVIERVDNTVVWTITTTETEHKGSGKCELFWYIGDALAKSIIFRTVVMEDIGAVVSDPPDPYESWVDSLTELGAEAQEYARQAASSADDAEAAAAQITGMTAEAETLPAGSDATASYEDGVLTIGVPTGAPGEDGSKGDPGQNGVSPTVTVADITGGHRVTITDASGTQTFDVMNGEPGEKGDNGFSPVVTVTEITGGHRVSITDASGTQTFDVMDGTGGGGGTSNYDDLSNKPQIGGVTLSGNKSASDLGLVAAEPGKGLSSNDFTSSEKNKLSRIPEGAEVNVQSDWNQSDSSADDFIKNKPSIPAAVTVDSALSDASENPVQNKVIKTALDSKGTYSKPSGGIPKTDLDSGVQTSLEKADSALQSYTETDPTVPAWAKSANKPSYTKTEVGLGNVDNVQQYSSNNPPPYPVSSVNGQTGAVVLTIPSTAADVGALPDDTTPADIGAAPAVTEVTISTAGAVSQALDAGKIYHFTGAVSSLSLTLNAAASGQLAQYHFDFSSGSTAATVTLAGVTWPDGSFTPEASKHYEVDILNGYGVWLAW